MTTPSQRNSREYPLPDEDAPSGHMVSDHRANYWFRVDYPVIDLYLPVMGATAFAVYACLCRHADWKTLMSFPGRDKIAEETGQSVRTVQRAINTLAGRDDVLSNGGLPPLVDIRPNRRKRGGWAHNEYIILPVPSAKSDIPTSVMSDTSVTHVSDTHVTHCVTPMSHEQESSNESEKIIGDADASSDATVSHEELETAPEDVPDGGSSPSPQPPSPITPHQLVAAYRKVTGLQVPERGKAYGAAKQLLQKGCTPADLSHLVAWVKGQRWASENGFDMATLNSVYERWRTATSVQAVEIPKDMIGAVKYPYRLADETVPETHEVEAALRRVIPQHEGLTPDDLVVAIQWKWRRMKHPPKIEHLAYFLNDWHEAGKPIPR